MTKLHYFFLNTPFDFDIFENILNIKYMFTEFSIKGKCSTKWILTKLTNLQETNSTGIFWIFFCTLLLAVLIVAALYYWKFGRGKEGAGRKNLKNYINEVHQTAGNLNPSTESIRRCIDILNHSTSFINHPKPPYNYTPFLRACWSGNVTLVRYMLRNGADVNSYTICKETPIYLASYRMVKSKIWNPSILELLFIAGSPLSVANTKGLTALHYAAHAGHLSLTRWLLMHGAHLSLPPTHKTPFDLAVRFRDEKHANVGVLLELFCPEMVRKYKKKLNQNQKPSLHLQN